MNTKKVRSRSSVRTVALIMLALLVVSAPAFALELLYDDFDYGGTAGDLTTVSSGNWTAHSGAGNLPVQYTTTGLSMAGYSSGTGGSATFANGSGSREDVNRTFAAQSSGTVYYAALVNLSSASDAYFLHLKDTGTGFRARVFADEDISGYLHFGLGASSSTGTYASTSFSYNTTYLVVASYDIDTGDSDLHVLSDCSPTEPGTPLVSDTGTSGTTISAVAIRQTSGSTAGTIDAVRVADSWADVVSSCNATAVELASFSAAPQGYAVQLEWETATELDNLGFHLYRSDSPAGARTRLNAHLIPAANPGSVLGATYQFADEAVAQGITYYYWLADVDLYGTATLHGPVSAELNPLRRLLPVRPRLASEPHGLRNR